jgi:hypothetical protein
VCTPFPPPLQQMLEACGDDLETVQQRDLGRYDRLLRETLQTVNLSAPEAQLVWHALTVIWQARIEGEPVPTLADAIETSYRRLWPSRPFEHVKLPDLLATVEGWPPPQQVAVIDACERFHRLMRAWRSGGPTMEEMFQRVGLVRR